MPTLAQTQPTATDRVRVLAGRLDTGWALIDAEPDPTRKVRLEAQWVRLLLEYETACDQEVSR